MHIFLYLFGGFLLATFGWVVAKTTVATRTIVSTIVLCLCVYTAYSFGRSAQKMLFLGSHIRSFEQYSATLVRLVHENRFDDLGKAVVWFDGKWRTDTQSSSNIVAIVAEFEKKFAGRMKRSGVGTGK